MFTASVTIPNLAQDTAEDAAEAFWGALDDYRRGLITGHPPITIFVTGYETIGDLDTPVAVYIDIDPITGGRIA